MLQTEQRGSAGQSLRRRGALVSWEPSAEKLLGLPAPGTSSALTPGCRRASQGHLGRLRAARCPWPRTAEARVSGLGRSVHPRTSEGQGSSAMSSSRGKLSVCLVASEERAAYGELLLGSVWAGVWCGGCCFFFKTVIRLLEKEPYHSSVCQIFQN